MTREELLQEMVRLGIRLTAAGGQLRINAPRGALSDAIREALLRHKSALLELLGGDEAADHQSVIEADLQHRFDPFPMSDLQLGFYIGQHRDMDYHVRPHYYNEIEWPGLDLERYRHAWHKALSHHLGSIATVGPDLMLHPLRTIPPLQFRCHDLRGQPEREVQTNLAAVRHRMMRAELPLDVWPWLDWEISLYGENDARIHYNHNNFFSDGPGSQRLLQLVERFYHDPDFEPSPLDITYRDCVLELERLAASERGTASRTYWERRLPQLPPPPSLPLVAKAEPRTRSYLSRRKLVLDADCWARFKINARTAGVTPSNAMAALYAELISRWCNSRHFILSNMVTRRFPLHPRIREVVGNFASLYPLEIDLREGETFAARAHTIQRQLMRDLDHLYWGGMQVFQALNSQHGESGRAGCPYVIGSGLFMAALDPDQFSCLETPQVLLDHQYWELEDGRFYAVWDVIEALFPEGLITDMWESYGTLIRRLSDEPGLWKAQNLIMPPKHQMCMRKEANATVTPPPDGVLHRALRDNAKRMPDKPALIDDSQTLSYGELERQVRSLAYAIVAEGGGLHKRVGVVAEKGVAQIVAVLGVVATGAAYVPLDPNLPGDRLRQLIADAGIALAVVDRVAVAKAALPRELACLLVDEAIQQDPGIDTLPLGPVPEDPAYIIYTSGSTGKPKGVVVDHRAALNTIVDVNRRFGIGADDRLFGISALSFDLSVYDIFGTLEAGATLVLPGPDEISVPTRWAERIHRDGVTVWNSVPALMQLLLETSGTESRLRNLRCVMLSGDWIPIELPAQLRRIVPDCRVIGMGGATEAAIWSIYHEIDNVDPQWSSIPYGRPLANQRFHVLDGEMQHCPDWVGGQLCIAGSGLALGYWGDPEKTAASFVDHPQTGERLYLTGDMGRYHPDGSIEFLGRYDSQVKIQGYRVELGEVETALRAIPNVADAAVIAYCSGNDQGRSLAAFVVLAESAGIDLDISAMRDSLTSMLPAYMVPPRIVPIESIPLTGNGKVDRKLLSVRLTQIEAEPQKQTRAEYMAARSPEEVTIVGIWEQVLGHSPIGIFDDFFELGGNSLAAVRILARIDEVIGIALPLAALLGGCTAAGLSEKLHGRYATDGDLSPIVRIGPAKQAARKLFLVHPAGGSVFCYRPLAEAVDDAVYAFQARGLNGDGAPQETIEEMAQWYIEALTQEQPHGPYWLGGWSSGAVIAYEMARRLEAAGEHVMRLITIDGPAPHTRGCVDEAVLARWFIEDLNEEIPLERLHQISLSNVPLERYLEVLLDAIQGLPSGMTAQQLSGNYAVFKAVISAVGRYRTDERIVADIDVFKAETNKVSEFKTHPAIDDPYWGWTAFTSGTVNSVTVPGDHYTIVVAPQVDKLAERLAEQSDAAATLS